MRIIRHPLFILVVLVCLLFYQFFLFGKVPFPGDLLVNSYSPWFDYYHFPTKNPEISDVFSQTYVWKNLAIESYKMHQWPLWNPYSFDGTHLLANFQSSVLYPLNVLLFLPYGWGLLIFSQCLLAAIVSYLYLSVWLKSSIAKIAGALIFTLGGLMTTWLELGTVVHTLLWLPLSFFAIEKFLITHKSRYLLLLIFSTAFSMLAGHAQLAVYSLLVVNVYVIFRYFTTEKHKIFRDLLPLGLCFLFALAISAPQLLPTYVLLQKSIRVNEFFSSGGNFGLLPIGNVFKFFAADVFGNPAKLNYWGSSYYTETSAFVGTICLPIILYAFWKLRKPRVIFFFYFLLFISLLLSFNNPISHFIYSSHVPLLSFITSSGANRWLFYTNFAVSIIVAFSLEKIFRDGEITKHLSRYLLWSNSAVVGLIAGFAACYGIIKFGALSSNQVYITATKGYFPNLVIAERNLVVPILILIIFSLVIYLGKIPFLGNTIRRFLSQYHQIIISVTILLLLCFDLGKYFFQITPFVLDKFTFPQTPSINYLQSKIGYQRFGREDGEVLPPNTWTYYHLPTYEGYDPLYLEKYSQYIHFLNSGNLVGNVGRYAEISSGYQSAFLDAAAVKYFLAVYRDKSGSIGSGNSLTYKFLETDYKVVFSDHTSAVLENPHALNRAYLMPSYTIADSQYANKLISQKGFDPRTTAVIEKDLGLKNITGIGKVEMINYTPNQVQIQTTTTGDELLILADQYDEGWKATVDGVSTPVARANLIFKGIKVPAGTHAINFIYQPFEFYLGLKIFLAAMLLLSFLTVFSWRWRTL